MTTKELQNKEPKIPGKLIRKDGDSYVVQREDGSIMVMEHNSLPSKTHQEFAAEVDVNNIMRKYTYSQLPDIPGTVAQFSQNIDYHDMLNETIRARASFQQLPAKLRQRFNDNPQDLINFVADSKNRDEAISLGLIAKPAEPDPVLAELKDLNKTLKTPKSKE